MELAFGILYFRFYGSQDPIGDVHVYLFSSCAPCGYSEGDGGVDDVLGSKEVLYLISQNIDSRCRPGGSSEARRKTTGARAEARAVDTTQLLAPEAPLK